MGFNHTTDAAVDLGEEDLVKRVQKALPTVVILLLILGVAAYLRFVGINWDDKSHPHPDERFLTMVETGISIPSNLVEYFDTDLSSLNPNNAGFGFFVYGTFPITLVRYIAEKASRIGYDEVHIVGRLASASFDVVSVFLVFLIGSELYRKRVGLLAAAFAAFSVLTIQHAHFFVVDPFANTFILVGIYFAIRIFKGGAWWNYLFFGVGLGLSTASKVNAFPLAFVLVIAVAVCVWRVEDQRQDAILRGVLGLVLAAGISLLVFRIFQPYAFEGPSFFGIRPNETFFSNLIEVRRQQTGAADFPPALQWAMRIPVLFSLKNLVVYGLGIPLGLASWLGFVWAFWRMVGKRELEHAMLVFWTGGYFLWQSSGFTQTMRYQLPIYPTLVILGAWGLWRFWDKASNLVESPRDVIARTLAVSAFIFVLGASALYAFAFVNIYQQPHSQVAASRWVYANIPGSFNLIMAGEGGEYLEPGILPSKSVLLPGEGNHLDLAFKPQRSGFLSSLQLNISDRSQGVGEDVLIKFTIYDDVDASVFKGTQTYDGHLPSGSLDIALNSVAPIDLDSGQEYLLRLELVEGSLIVFEDAIRGRLSTGEGRETIIIPLTDTFALLGGESHVAQMYNRVASEVVGVYLPYTSSLVGEASSVRLEVELIDPQNDQIILAEGMFDGDIPGASEDALRLNFEDPVELNAEQTYRIRFRLNEGLGLRLRRSRIVNESTWDLGLPFNVDGRSGYNGLYSGLNQELYWADNEDRNNNQISDKLERIVGTMSEGDYLTIATNRQYGTISRVPTRYPLTTAYYRALLGCHWPEEVIECAARAQPGEITAELGYELVAVFQSNPRVAGLEFNDQLAEEAFTVYDHPKVLIFQKTANFSPDLVREVLGDIDVSYVENSAPKDLSSIPSNVQFVDEDFKALTQSGTWSELFDREDLVNRYPFISVVVWWVAITLLGVVIFPITRIVFRGLFDSGYSFAKLFALLLLSYAVWIGGHSGIPFERPQIFFILLLLIFLSAILAWRDREQIRAFFRDSRKTIVLVEALALGFFLLDLAIRLGNPDLWHPFKGGEKPMDFSYLNAVLKSSSFPPYDPWFAGGYINYYYYGFVLVGVPIKLLGIVPSSAYNLVIPTLFSMLAMGAYSVGYNLYLGLKGFDTGQFRKAARIAGVITAIVLILLGNLGTARLIYEELQDLGDPTGAESDLLLSAPNNAIKGLNEVLFKGGSLNISLERWYWDPTRAIEPGPNEAGPINEFPFFTFLYADLHAHMINLPLTVGAIGWGVGWLYRRRAGKWKLLDDSIGILMGSLILGALRPTNSWDFPTYWTLAGIATLVAPVVRDKKIGPGQVIEALVSTAALIGLAYFLFHPYTLWYRQEYTTAERWYGSQTGLNDYITAHGVFIPLILAWFLWETREWMSNTPLSSLRKYQRGILLTIGVTFIFMLIVALLTFQGFGGAPVAFLMLFWSGLLLIRRDLTFEKRIVLFFIGTASALTILVEFIVLQGDISRMNTVFKFYLQVWTLMSISTAGSIVWIYRDLHRWRPRWRTVWLGMATVVLFLAALYPITATVAKVKDRMSDQAPHSLDGMAFMQSSTYYDISGPMPLDEDYDAIRWMQENIEGSPVIVEANTPEYRWGSRFTIHTGLPGVLGWNWHQRQQRGATAGSEVVDRARGIASLYTDNSIDNALEFLREYDVDYVIVGQLERQYYETVKPCWENGSGDGVTCDLHGRPMGMQDPQVHPSDCSPIDDQANDESLVCPTFGLVKFGDMEQMGVLQEVYHQGATSIYQVLK